MYFINSVLNEFSEKGRLYRKNDFRLLNNLNEVIPEHESHEYDLFEIFEPTR